MKRVVLCVLLFALAGCGSASEPETARIPSGAQSESAPATTIVSISWTECVNDVEGYAISYPKSWHTATLAPEDECAFFDPEPFEIVEGSKFPVTVLEAHWLQEGRSFGKSFKNITASTFERTLSVDVYGEGQLSGLKLETEATGEGLPDKGTRTYEYLLNVDDRASSSRRRSSAVAITRKRSSSSTRRCRRCASSRTRAASRSPSCRFPCSRRAAP